MLGLSLHCLDWWRRAAALGWGNLDRLAALHDPRRLRSWWLADLRQLTADTIKSPAFLAMMRLNLTFMTLPMMTKAAQMIALPIR